MTPSDKLTDAMLGPVEPTCIRVGGPGAGAGPLGPLFDAAAGPSASSDFCRTEDGRMPLDAGCTAGCCGGSAFVEAT